MATQQGQTIANANTIIGLTQSLQALYLQIRAASEAWTDDATANQLNALPTAPYKTDGSLGTADTTPNTANPIDTRIITTLSRTVSANSVASMLTILQNVKTYVEGGAVAATPGVRAILNNAVGG
jgi:hypothetical protein